MQENREKVAISAYLSLLKSKGVDQTMLAMRESILNQLTPRLAGKSLDGTGYRKVIEDHIEQIPAEDWPMHLSTAREYYHFLVQDLKAIANINQAQGFDHRPAEWSPAPVDLKEITERLKTEKFEAVEIWPLKGYQQALKNAGAGQLLVDARAKLAKIVMIRLREAQTKNQQSYRMVVDSTLPLFRLKKSRKLFLEVVREFYHFWSGNPEASNLVFQA